MLEETIETQQREEIKEEVKLASASKIYKNLFKFATKSMKNGSMRFLEPGNNNYVLGDTNSPHEDYHNALVQINSPNEFYKKAVLFGDVGFSEAYMDGDWDTDNITNAAPKTNVDNYALVPKVGCLLFCCFRYGKKALQNI
jgi:cyclopropane-fatty-acyl-phospholipid synthase